MSWFRIVIEFVVAFLAIWVLQRVMPIFPKFGIGNVAIVSVAVALVSYAVTEMPGGYASAYGRAVLAWIAGWAVLAIYFTTLPRTTGHPYGYLEAALVFGVIIGLTELAVAPKNARQAHGSK
ncbi:hypothetical protein [Sulfobacillus harzensis]|uniref:Uncharacterized protein n=1 Tax=Sulfobacillus harzensis TaxID=2729629 RepID=A0A7Y0Q2X0_9FIRM|nr:hypothetical protein [Sulfobacillus harzensis]NMP22336.1 hypothetical protein [Sulfobacillus harzensis]